MARGLKFWIWVVEGLHYLYSENKGADQLRGYREADLRLCFRICKKPVFSQRGSNSETVVYKGILFLLLVFVHKHRLWVLVRTASQIFLSENCHFNRCKNSSLLNRHVIVKSYGLVICGCSHPRNICTTIRARTAVYAPSINWIVSNGVIFSRFVIYPPRSEPMQKDEIPATPNIKNKIFEQHHGILHIVSEWSFDEHCFNVGTLKVD